VVGLGSGVTHLAVGREQAYAVISSACSAGGRGFGGYKAALVLEPKGVPEAGSDVAATSIGMSHNCLLTIESGAFPRQRSMSSATSRRRRF